MTEKEYPRRIANQVHNLAESFHSAFGPVDAELLHPAAERAGVHAQNFRRAALALDHPVGLIQHRLDVVLFHFL